MNAQRSHWSNEPLKMPQEIPPPARVWTEEEMQAIRRGYVPQVMDEKWFIFVEDDRLYAHRSWTGIGVYEAAFAPVEGGYAIESAVVTGDESAYRRSSDQDESHILEMLVVGHLTGEPISTEGLSQPDPIVALDRTLRSIPKQACLPTVVKKAAQPGGP
ncbi:MAG: hypothetical protein OXF64_02340 [bacterium]|nr:hypothetical protein [bacterium]